MTTPTDSELDALVADLIHTGDLSMLYRMEIADAITAMRAELAAERAKVEVMRVALQTLRNLMCEGIEDDDGNSGCGRCENDCTGCIAHFALNKIGAVK